MRTSILLLFLLAVIFSSCTSAYKSGQTPDDVYYSPQRMQDDYLTTNDNNEGYYPGNNPDYDDNYLRMKVQDRALWSTLDDWYPYYPQYSFGFCDSWGLNPWTPFSYWNYYYNPYFSPVYFASSPLIFVSKTDFVYSRPRVFNLNTYTSPQVSRSYNSRSGGGVYNNYENTSNYSGRRVNQYNSNTGSNTGNFLRNIFNGSNSSSGSSNSSSRSSGSGGGGGSAPVRRF